MSQIDQNVKYKDSHEWVKVEDDIAVVGISDHAQSLLGELVYVELPEVGAEVSAEDEVCVVESVKAASDVYSPVSGEIVEVNETLEDEPSLVNEEPFAGGWLYKIKLSDPSEVDAMMDADKYAACLDD